MSQIQVRPLVVAPPRYVPPNPADIDSARKRDQVAAKPGDLLAVDLDAKAKNVTVVVQKSGYRPAGR